MESPGSGVDEYRLHLLAQAATWYFEENLSPLSPLQMAQCFSNAWVSRRLRCQPRPFGCYSFGPVGWGMLI